MLVIVCGLPGSGKSTLSALLAETLPAVHLNSDPIKNIFNWEKDGSSLMVLNMPFEFGSNSSYTRDYSGFGNDGSQTNSSRYPLWSNSSGHDGRGGSMGRAPPFRPETA